VDCVCEGSIQFELNDEQHALREAAHLYTVFATLDRASRDTCSIHFDGIRVPESQRLAIARELFRD
jgi:hypothetical protein